MSRRGDSGHATVSPPPHLHRRCTPPPENAVLPPEAALWTALKLVISNYAKLFPPPPQSSANTGPGRGGAGFGWNPITAEATGTGHSCSSGRRGSLTPSPSATTSPFSVRVWDYMEHLLFLESAVQRGVRIRYNRRRRTTETTAEMTADDIVVAAPSLLPTATPPPPPAHDRSVSVSFSELASISFEAAQDGVPLGKVIADDDPHNYKNRAVGRSRWLRSSPSRSAQHEEEEEGASTSEGEEGMTVVDPAVLSGWEGSSDEETPRHSSGSSDDDSDERRSEEEDEAEEPESVEQDHDVIVRVRWGVEVVVAVVTAGIQHCVLHEPGSSEGTTIAATPTVSSSQQTRNTNFSFSGGGGGSTTSKEDPNAAGDTSRGHMPWVVVTQWASIMALLLRRPASRCNGPTAEGGHHHTTTTAMLETEEKEEAMMEEEAIATTAVLQLALRPVVQRLWHFIATSLASYHQSMAARWFGWGSGTLNPTSSGTGANTCAEELAAGGTFGAADANGTAPVAAARKASRICAALTLLRVILSSLRVSGWLDSNASSTSSLLLPSRLSSHVPNACRAVFLETLPWLLWSSSSSEAPPPRNGFASLPVVSLEHLKMIRLGLLVHLEESTAASLTAAPPSPIIVPQPFPMIRSSESVGTAGGGATSSWKVRLHLAFGSAAVVNAAVPLPAAVASSAQLSLLRPHHTTLTSSIRHNLQHHTPTRRAALSSLKAMLEIGCRLPLAESMKLLDAVLASLGAASPVFRSVWRPTDTASQLLPSTEETHEWNTGEVIGYLLCFVQTGLPECGISDVLRLSATPADATPSAAGADRSVSRPLSTPSASSLPPATTSDASDTKVPPAGLHCAFLGHPRRPKDSLWMAVKLLSVRGGVNEVHCHRRWLAVALSTFLYTTVLPSSGSIVSALVMLCRSLFSAVKALYRGKAVLLLRNELLRVAEVLVEAVRLWASRTEGIHAAWQILGGLHQLLRAVLALRHPEPHLLHLALLSIRAVLIPRVTNTKDVPPGMLQDLLSLHKSESLRCLQYRTWEEEEAAAAAARDCPPNPDDFPSVWSSSAGCRYYADVAAEIVGWLTAFNGSLAHRHWLQACLDRAATASAVTTAAAAGCLAASSGTPSASELPATAATCRRIVDLHHHLHRLFALPSALLQGSALFPVLLRLIALLGDGAKAVFALAAVPTRSRTEEEEDTTHDRVAALLLLALAEMRYFFQSVVVLYRYHGEKLSSQHGEEDVGAGVNGATTLRQEGQRLHQNVSALTHRYVKWVVGVLVTMPPPRDSRLDQRSPAPSSGPPSGRHAPTPTAIRPTGLWSYFCHFSELWGLRALETVVLYEGDATASEERTDHLRPEDGSEATTLQSTNDTLAAAARQPNDSSRQHVWESPAELSATASLHLPTTASSANAGTTTAAPAPPKDPVGPRLPHHTDELVMAILEHRVSEVNVLLRHCRSSTVPLSQPLAAPCRRTMEHLLELKCTVYGMRAALWHQRRTAHYHEEERRVVARVTRLQRRHCGAMSRLERSALLLLPTVSPHRPSAKTVGKPRQCHRLHHDPTAEVARSPTPQTPRTTAKERYTLPEVLSPTPVPPPLAPGDETADASPLLEDEDEDWMTVRSTALPKEEANSIAWAVTQGLKDLEEISQLGFVLPLQEAEEEAVTVTQQRRGDGAPWRWCTATTHTTPFFPCPNAEERRRSGPSRFALDTLGGGDRSPVTSTTRAEELLGSGGGGAPLVTSFRASQWPAEEHFSSSTALWSGGDGEGASFSSSRVGWLQCPPEPMTRAMAVPLGIAVGEAVGVERWGLSNTEGGGGHSVSSSRTGPALSSSFFTVDVSVLLRCGVFSTGMVVEGVFQLAQEDVIACAPQCEENAQAAPHRSAASDPLPRSESSRPSRSHHAASSKEDIPICDNHRLVEEVLLRVMDLLQRTVQVEFSVGLEQSVSSGGGSATMTPRSGPHGVASDSAASSPFLAGSGFRSGGVKGFTKRLDKVPLVWNLLWVMHKLLSVLVAYMAAVRQLEENLKRQQRQIHLEKLLWTSRRLNQLKHRRVLRRRHSHSEPDHGPGKTDGAVRYQRPPYISVSPRNAAEGSDPDTRNGTAHQRAGPRDADEADEALEAELLHATAKELGPNTETPYQHHYERLVRLCQEHAPALYRVAQCWGHWSCADRQRYVKTWWTEGEPTSQHPLLDPHRSHTMRTLSPFSLSMLCGEVCSSLVALCGEEEEAATVMHDTLVGVGEHPASSCTNAMTVSPRAFYLPALTEAYSATWTTWVLIGSHAKAYALRNDVPRPSLMHLISSYIAARTAKNPKAAAVGAALAASTSSFRSSVHSGLDPAQPPNKTAPPRPAPATTSSSLSGSSHHSGVLRGVDAANSTPAASPDDKGDHTHAKKTAAEDGSPRSAMLPSLLKETFRLVLQQSGERGGVATEMGGDAAVVVPPPIALGTEMTQTPLMEEIQRLISDCFRRYALSVFRQHKESIVRRQLDVEAELWTQMEATHRRRAQQQAMRLRSGVAKGTSMRQRRPREDWRESISGEWRSSSFLSSRHSGELAAAPLSSPPLTSADFSPMQSLRFRGVGRDAKTAQPSPLMSASISGGMRDNSPLGGEEGSDAQMARRGTLPPVLQCSNSFSPSSPRDAPSVPVTCAGSPLSSGRRGVLPQQATSVFSDEERVGDRGGPPEEASAAPASNSAESVAEVGSDDDDHDDDDHDEDEMDDEMDDEAMAEEEDRRVLKKWWSRHERKEEAEEEAMRQRRTPIWEALESVLLSTSNAAPLLWTSGQFDSFVSLLLSVYRNTQLLLLPPSSVFTASRAVAPPRASNGALTPTLHSGSAEHRTPHATPKPASKEEVWRASRLHEMGKMTHHMGLALTILAVPPHVAMNTSAPISSAALLHQALCTHRLCTAGNARRFYQQSAFFSFYLLQRASRRTITGEGTPVDTEALVSDVPSSLSSPWHTTTVSAQGTAPYSTYHYAFTSWVPFARAVHTAMLRRSAALDEEQLRSEEMVLEHTLQNEQRYQVELSDRLSWHIFLRLHCFSMASSTSNDSPSAPVPLAGGEGGALLQRLLAPSYAERRSPRRAEGRHEEVSGTTAVRRSGGLPPPRPVHHPLVSVHLSRLMRYLYERSAVFGSVLADGRTATAAVPTPATALSSRRGTMPFGSQGPTFTASLCDDFTRFASSTLSPRRERSPQEDRLAISHRGGALHSATGSMVDSFSCSRPPPVSGMFRGSHHRTTPVGRDHEHRRPHRAHHHPAPPKLPPLYPPPTTPFTTVSPALPVYLLPPIPFTAPPLPLRGWCVLGDTLADPREGEAWRGVLRVSLRHSVAARRLVEREKSWRKRMKSELQRRERAAERSSAALSSIVVGVLSADRRSPSRRAARLLEATARERGAAASSQTLTSFLYASVGAAEYSNPVGAWCSSCAAAGFYALGQRPAWMWVRRLLLCRRGAAATHFGWLPPSDAVTPNADRVAGPVHEELPSLHDVWSERHRRASVTSSGEADSFDSRMLQSLSEVVASPRSGQRWQTSAAEEDSEGSERSSSSGAEGEVSLPPEEATARHRRRHSTPQGDRELSSSQQALLDAFQMDVGGRAMLLCWMEELLVQQRLEDKATRRFLGGGNAPGEQLFLSPTEACCAGDRPHFPLPPGPPAAAVTKPATASRVFEEHHEYYSAARRSTLLPERTSSTADAAARCRSGTLSKQQRHEWKQWQADVLQSLRGGDPLDRGIPRSTWSAVIAALAVMEEIPGAATRHSLCHMLSLLLDQVPTRAYYEGLEREAQVYEEAERRRCSTSVTDEAGWERAAPPMPVDLEQGGPPVLMRRLRQKMERLRRCQWKRWRGRAASMQELLPPLLAGITALSRRCVLQMRSGPPPTCLAQQSPAMTTSTRFSESLLQGHGANHAMGRVEMALGQPPPVAASDVNGPFSVSSFWQTMAQSMLLTPSSARRTVNALEVVLLAEERMEKRYAIFATPSERSAVVLLLLWSAGYYSSVRNVVGVRLRRLLQREYTRKARQRRDVSPLESSRSSSFSSFPLNESQDGGTVAGGRVAAREAPGVEPKSNDDGIARRRLADLEAEENEWSAVCVACRSALLDRPESQRLLAFTFQQVLQTLVAPKGFALPPPWTQMLEEAMEHSDGSGQSLHSSMEKGSEEEGGGGGGAARSPLLRFIYRFLLLRETTLDFDAQNLFTHVFGESGMEWSQRGARGGGRRWKKGPRVGGPLSPVSLLLENSDDSDESAEVERSATRLPAASKSPMFQPMTFTSISPTAADTTKHDFQRQSPAPYSLPPRSTGSAERISPLRSPFAPHCVESPAEQPAAPAQCWETSLLPMLEAFTAALLCRPLQSSLQRSSESLTAEQREPRVPAELITSLRDVVGSAAVVLLALALPSATEKGDDEEECCPSFAGVRALERQPSSERVSTQRCLTCVFHLLPCLSLRHQDLITELLYAHCLQHPESLHPTPTEEEDEKQQQQQRGTPPHQSLWWRAVRLLATRCPRLHPAMSLALLSRHAPITVAPCCRVALLPLLLRSTAAAVCQAARETNDGLFASGALLLPSPCAAMECSAWASPSQAVAVSLQQQLSQSLSQMPVDHVISLMGLGGSGEDAASLRHATCLYAALLGWSENPSWCCAAANGASPTWGQSAAGNVPGDEAELLWKLLVRRAMLNAPSSAVRALPHYFHLIYFQYPLHSFTGTNAPPFCVAATPASETGLALRTTLFSSRTPSLAAMSASSGTTGDADDVLSVARCITPPSPLSSVSNKTLSVNGIGALPLAAVSPAAALLCEAALVRYGSGPTERAPTSLLELLPRLRRLSDDALLSCESPERYGNCDEVVLSPLTPAPRFLTRHVAESPVARCFSVGSTPSDSEQRAPLAVADTATAMAVLEQLVAALVESSHPFQALYLMWGGEREGARAVDKDDVVEREAFQLMRYFLATPGEAGDSTARLPCLSFSRSVKPAWKLSLLALLATAHCEAESEESNAATMKQQRRSAHASTSRAAVLGVRNATHAPSSSLTDVAAVQAKRCWLEPIVLLLMHRYLADDDDEEEEDHVPAEDVRPHEEGEVERGTALSSPTRRRGVVGPTRTEASSAAGPQHDGTASGFGQRLDCFLSLFLALVQQELQKARDVPPSEGLSSQEARLRRLMQGGGNGVAEADTVFTLQRLGCWISRYIVHFTFQHQPDVTKAVVQRHLRSAEGELLRVCLRAGTEGVSPAA